MLFLLAALMLGLACEAELAASDRPTEPEWYRWDGDDSEPYRDVHSRGATYPDVHEASHQLNAALMNRNNCWGKSAAIYVLRGRWTMVKHPPVTLRQLADAIPKEKRGRMYFYIDSPHWEQSHSANVLYEAACYANEHEWDRTDFGLDCASELTGYAETLVVLAERHPRYDIGSRGALCGGTESESNS